MGQFGPRVGSWRQVNPDRVADKRHAAYAPAGDDVVESVGMSTVPPLHGHCDAHVDLRGEIAHPESFIEADCQGRVDPHVPVAVGKLNILNWNEFGDGLDSHHASFFIYRICSRSTPCSFPMSQICS